MPRLRIGRSLWQAAADQAHTVRFPTLRSALSVDVVIVGGGMTGAAIAWRFATAGVAVALIEGREIGRGSTSASSALLMQEPDADLTALTQRYGPTRARR